MHSMHAGAMLLVLMMAHTSSHEYMRARLQTFLERRVAVQFALDQGHLGYAEYLPGGSMTDNPSRLQDASDS